MALQNKRFIGYAQLWFIIFDFLKLAFVCFTPSLWCVGVCNPGKESQRGAGSAYGQWDGSGISALIYICWYEIR